MAYIRRQMLGNDKLDQRMVVRFTKAERRFIRAAAKRAGYRTLSEFVRITVLRAAKEVLAENGHTKHTPADGVRG